MTAGDVHEVPILLSLHKDLQLINQKVSVNIDLKEKKGKKALPAHLERLQIWKKKGSSPAPVNLLSNRLASLFNKLHMHAHLMRGNTSTLSTLGM